MSSLVRHPLLALAVLLGSCATDSLATYRASMPAPLPAPTADQFEAVQNQAQASRDQTLARGAPMPASVGFSYLARPTERDFAAVYPADALRRGVTGHVVLNCLIQADGQLACAVASEDPPGEGFGEAARRVAVRFRMPTHLSDGRPTVGGTVTLPITFTFR